jgi:2-polyprenyl-3-methyl-5-hydroxy-6-metoxy-1,4-benzoquinol methylase
MSREYRDRIYREYVSSQFGHGHDVNALSSEYKVHSRYFKKNYEKYLPKNKECRILDAGCGMGHFLYFVKELGYKNVIGIDTSQELVELCRKNGLVAQVNQISSFLKENESSFDVIVFNDVVEHLGKEEIVEILDLMHLSLKDGGCLMIKTPNMANPITAAGGRYIDFTHEIGFTEASLREILVVTRFRNIRVFGTDIYIFYGNPINYLARFSAFMISRLLYLLSYLYGRGTLKIYEKDLLAVANK